MKRMGNPFAQNKKGEIRHLTIAAAAAAAALSSVQTCRPFSLKTLQGRAVSCIDIR